MSRRVVVIVGSIVGVLVLTAGAALAVALVRADEIVPGVTIAGQDVGGMDRAGAEAVVEALQQDRLALTLELSHEGTDYGFDPVSLGAAVDAGEVVTEALQIGRDGGWWSDQWAALVGAETDVSVDSTLDVDAVVERVAEIATLVDVDPFPGNVRIDAVTLEVATDPPSDGLRVDVEAAAELVRTAVISGTELSAALPTMVVPADTDEEDLAEVVEAAERAIDGDLTIRSSDGEIVLAPRDIAQLVQAGQVGTGADASLRLLVTPEAVGEVLVPLAGPLLREPVDATYDAPREPEVVFDDKDDTSWSPLPAEVRVVPGSNGTFVDPQIAADQLSTSLQGGARSLQLRLGENPPDFSTEQAESYTLDQLLSTFTTYHSCCQTRVHNIQRLAGLVDGTVVQPGEQFSINQISGVRECSKGFRPAGMILNGEIVDSCGGGVSQFGTTTVNAVFFAGLTPDAYKPHSFYISRYPMAREATLNFPSPDIDVQFTNDTGTPILIRTAFTGTSITVTFYGSSDVDTVEADVGSPTNVKPFRVVRRVNNSLAPGQEVRIQGGRNGFYVGLTRTITRVGGAVEEDDWGNTYVPETEIYEYNPAPVPRPSPTPTPTPSPTPSPTPTSTPSPTPSPAPTASPSPDGGGG